jgi:hypothetical protein
MRLFVIAAALAASSAHAQCVPLESSQYKNKIAGPDGPRALAGDVSAIRKGVDNARSRGDARAVEGCIVELRKLTEAAAAAGKRGDVEIAADAVCPRRKP